MKNLYRAAYGDDSRIMFIIAETFDEAIELANNKIIDETIGLENYDEENDVDELPFIFDNESVFKIDMTRNSQIVEDLSINSFI